MPEKIFEEEFVGENKEKPFSLERKSKILSLEAEIDRLRDDLRLARDEAEKSRIEAQLSNTRDALRAERENTRSNFIKMVSQEIISKIKPGARVKVYEGKTPFAGLVIARKHGSEPGATFTVRTILAGVGVEKVYPIHSPAIAKVEVVSSPRKVHRSKLYFVRKMSGARIRQKLGVSV